VVLNQVEWLLTVSVAVGVINTSFIKELSMGTTKFTKRDFSRFRKKVWEDFGEVVWNSNGKSEDQLMLERNQTILKHGKEVGLTFEEAWFKLFDEPWSKSESPGQHPGT